jgi:YHS domain-containing protein
MEAPEAPAMRFARLLPFVAALALAACGDEGPRGDDYPPATLAAAAKAAGTVNGLCPIMKRPVETGTSADFVEYTGEKIGFCCPPCRAKFLKDADKYLAEMRAEPAKYAYKRP